MTFNQTYLVSICRLATENWCNLYTDEIIFFFKYSLAYVKAYILVALIDIQPIF